MMGQIAPGARILCRDAEWLVKATARSSDGGTIIEAIGVSEFIRGRTARFIQELETDLEVLRPEETKLVADTSPGYRHSLLFLEASLRQTVPDDARIYLGQRAAMDVMPYQLWPASKALAAPRQRILIADAVGLGKTLECGILCAELMRRGRGRRILVITTKSMMTQFQKEFWSRFTIPLARLDSQAIQRIRTQIPGNHNPFHYYDRSIISVDTLKQDREYRSYLEQAYWDIIVIDEAHNVARRGKGQGASQRAKLAERLATRSDTLILLSATPHDGRPESFASLMNMLDPTAIANESKYTKEDIRDLYVRRFKKDVLNDLRQHVPERNVEPVEAQASGAEERVLECLDGLRLVGIDGRRKGEQLFKTTLLKAMLSSPMACLETVENRLKRLGDDPGMAETVDELAELRSRLLQVDGAAFSKYQRLLQLIRKDFGWTGKDATDRLVIFTGRLETLRFLKQHLAEDLKLKPEAIVVLDGGMADVEQNQVVEAFGQESAKVRVLIATEVASEGLNLHYLSHKLIHFDIPWSLMTLQQRNGRIDRYGQTRQPEIRYLLTRSRIERMDEVERIVQVLLNKDEQAIQNIGDPSVFMGVFDAAQEEAVTATAIEAGMSADDFSAQLDRTAATGGETDIFDWFENPDSFAATIAGQEIPQAETGVLMQLFSTFEFTAQALRSLELPPENLNINESERFIELKLPKDLERRYQRLPKELQPQEKRLTYLTDSPQEVMQAMAAARKLESSWPQKEYLWDLHPVVEWAVDRCAFRFGRHQAPVMLVSEGLAIDETLFVMLGSFPNRRGVPVLNRWVAAVFKQGKFEGMEPFAETLARTKLGRQDIPNPGALKLDLEALERMREKAVQMARDYLQDQRSLFQRQLQPQLEEYRERLERLKGQHLEQLQLQFGTVADRTIQQQRKRQQEDRTERIFRDYREWVELSMATESTPFIKLVTVLRRVD
ncbi:MAG: helicase [Alkalinema sp. CACIAM 70d]|nr:MAG: helicase [Alkalinema sp. CACIAM 70d]